MRKLVKQLKGDMRELPDVTLPLYFAPSEECQIDWGEATIILQGVEQVANYLIVTLCFLRRTFAMAFPSQKQEAFLEAHVRAFEYFGGQTERNAYDNLTTAVKNILVGGAREENETFLASRLYYGFETRFCTPGKEGAHEKGRVDRRVSLIRTDVFVPVPEVSSWEELRARETISEKISISRARQNAVIPFSSEFVTLQWNGGHLVVRYPNFQRIFSLIKCALHL